MGFAEEFQVLAHIFNAGFVYNKFTEFIKNKQYLKAKDHELIKILDEVIFGEEFRRFSCTIPKETILFRARIVKEKDISISNGFRFDNSHTTFGFDEINSREPPLYLAPAGRVNIAGQSYFYAAETERTACEEVRSNPHQVISLARFRLSKDLSVVDFATDQEFPIQYRERYNMSPGHFFTAIMLSFSKPPQDEGDYQATQFIADHIRKTGIDGICYMSLFTRKKNYAIFNCHHSIVEFIDSELVFKTNQISSYISLKNSKDALFQDESVLQLSDRDKSKIVENVRDQLTGKLK